MEKERERIDFEEGYNKSNTQFQLESHSDGQFHSRGQPVSSFAT